MCFYLLPFKVKNKKGFKEFGVVVMLDISTVFHPKLNWRNLMKELAENLKQYLHVPGTVVYIQNSAMRDRSKRGVDLISYTHDEAIDFFQSLHEKVIDADDLEKFSENEEMRGTPVFVRNGTRGIVLSCFHWGFTQNEIDELIEAEKIKSAEEATPAIYCFLLLDEHVVLARETVCNPLKDV